MGVRKLHSCLTVTVAGSSIGGECSSQLEGAETCTRRNWKEFCVCMIAVLVAGLWQG